MENAKITEDQMYQQGKYPSIVDTDDLVFELGKQAVNNINHEKLITQLIDKARKNEFEFSKINSIQESNKIYEQNNKELNDEIIKLRREIESTKNDFLERESVLNDTITRLKSRKTKLKQVQK